MLTKTIKPTPSVAEQLSILAKWHDEGCPTKKTLPRREAAAKRIEEYFEAQRKRQRKPRIVQKNDQRGTI